MGIDIGVIGNSLPDVATVAGSAGDLLGEVLPDSPSISLQWDEGVAESHWQIDWTAENSVWAVIVPPGRHEFEDQWFLSLSPGERGDDSSLLLCIIAAIVSAENIKGAILDELGIVGGGMMQPDDVRSRLVAAAPASPSVLLAALR